MAVRGSIAPLSGNEEVTLRRIALGLAAASNLSPQDLTRLKTLALVEIDGLPEPLRGRLVNVTRYLAARQA